VLGFTGMTARARFEARWRAPFGVLALLVTVLAAAASSASDTGDVGTVGEAPLHFRSSFLDGEIVVQPGVFQPLEAEQTVLPMMAEHAGVFRGKSVLEIGTGSGIISLYAIQLGAARVVSTDINPAAVATARENAERLGFGERMDVRRVPPADMSAYSVLEPGERFDVIISNPPYSLDLDAEKDDAVTDTGDLGFSIVRGLDERLTPDGMALLLYASLFYHEVMLKYAKHEGFEVHSDPSPVLTPWEAGALFNSYLARLLEREGVDRDAFRFDWRKEASLRLRASPPTRTAFDRLRWLVTGEGGIERGPLFPDSEPGDYPGWLRIRRARAQP
jgi:SAM-dependent methyltransferase